MRKAGVRLMAVSAALACFSPALANQSGNAADDALVSAIRANDLASAQAALARRANPNQPQPYGATPLAMAINTQNPEMVDTLLAAGAKTDVADVEGVTPLALACELGDGEIVAKLLDSKANVTSAAPDGTTPIAICARHGPANSVARMLAMGAKPDSIDARGQTPLMWAASTGRVETIALLLKAGAQVNRVSSGGFTPLFFAIKSGVPAASEALLKGGADPDHRGPENTSAAQLAVYQHNYAAAALLVERGANIAERDRHGNQLLHAAAAGGDSMLIQLLLAKGADPNGLTGPSKITWVTEANFGVPPPPIPPTPPLLSAAENGRAEAMKLLVAAGANPRFVADNGVNVVLAAAKGGSAAALDYALSLAPDVNAVDAKGETALHWVLFGGVKPELEAMLQVLAKHGARTDIKDKGGHTAAAAGDNGLTEVRVIFRKVFANEIHVGFTQNDRVQA